MIPYGHQWIDEDDINSVVEALRSNWLTTGPKVIEFENDFAKYVGARHAVAVSSGTAALHAAMFAIDVQPGDEVIVPTMTFAASANCVLFQGGTPVFVDVAPDTLLINPVDAEKKISLKTKAIIAVDYSGQPCDYDAIRQITDRNGLALVADGCHALGASFRGRTVGTLADLTVFSFHPVKHITTAEGGMIVTDNEELVERMRVFRNHGITTDHRQREARVSWYYEMHELGYNYRLTDVQSALGQSQLRKQPLWLERRREIARRYDEAFSEAEGIKPLAVRSDVRHAYHLYVVRVDKDQTGKDRATFFRDLRSRGVGVNVHYIPVHLHPYYRDRLGTSVGLCPVAEAAYEEIVSLPIFPAMSDGDVEFVIEAVKASRSTDAGSLR